MGVSGLALVEPLGTPLRLTPPLLQAGKFNIIPNDHQRGLRGGTHGSGEALSPPPDPLSTAGGGGTAQGRELSQRSRRNQSWGGQCDGAEGFLGLHTPSGGPHVSVPAWDSLPRARGFCLWLGSWGFSGILHSLVSTSTKRQILCDIQGFQPWPHLYFGPDNFFCGVIVCVVECLTASPASP